MICHVTVTTSKFEETVSFYQWLLGLPIFNRINSVSGEIVFLGNNETKFEIISNNNAEKINSKGITVGFKVANLDEKIAMLKEKSILHSDIICVPNARFVFFTDLNGLNIQLFEG